MEGSRKTPGPHNVMLALSKKYNFSLDTPINELPDEIVDILLYGTKGEKILVHYDREFSSGQFNHIYEGEINILKRRYLETNSDVIKAEIEQYMSDNPCPKCKGDRLKPEALAVTVGNLNIAEFCKLSISDELKYLKNLSYLKSRK